MSDRTLAERRSQWRGLWRVALPWVLATALLKVPFLLGQAAGAQNPLEAAAAAEQAGRYDEAANLYQRFLTGADSSKISSATEVHVRTRLATAYFLLHRYRESLEAIAPLTSKNSGHAQLPAQAWLVDGLDRLESGQVPEAIASLRRTLELNPDSGTARLALADAFERSGRLEEATGEYEEQTRRTPSEPDAWYKLGLAYARLATTVSHDFNQKFPDSVVGQQLTAEDLLTKGDGLGAAGILLRLVRRASSQPGIHAALGSALLNQEFPKSAEDQFRQELSQNPDCPLARLGLAETAFLRGDWQEAISDLGRLARLEPRELARLLEFKPPPRVRQVWVEGKIRLPEHLAQSPEGRLWEAWLKNSASLPMPAAADAGQPCPSPSSKVTTTPGLWLSEPCYRLLRDRLKTRQAKTTVERLKLAEAELRLGDYQAARREAQGVLASDPRNEWAIYWLSLSDGELAEDCLSKVASLSPDSPRVHQMLGEYFVDRHNFPRARTEYESAIRLAPDLAELHLGLGTVLWLEGEWPEAETELERTLVLAPGSTAAQYELGDAYIQQRRWQLATERLRRALDDPALSIKARLDLAEAEAEMGQMNQAIEELLPILKEDQDGEIHYRLAGFYRKLGDKTRMDEAFGAFTRLRSAAVKADRQELEAMEKQREGAGRQGKSKPPD
jgi:tetratricopeptide (TPR) repeat protein